MTIFPYQTDGASHFHVTWERVTWSFEKSGDQYGDQSMAPGAGGRRRAQALSRGEAEPQLLGDLQGLVPNTDTHSRKSSRTLPVRQAAKPIQGSSK